ncbi:MAG: hypothetical protein UT24_C0003G0002 [Candidatus Woesebacteria bacterium GW2011_GWB1_39_12]|uniref:Uncharacterized protein n=1 Tax=Candidatus Woesebacteria bacterium GW2011_GWB1_39_12 TaxID=1618574 RepID=A0A0G0PTU9_9BACT|nr:MAG: hypothetical protein UT24_C0003G0002 [Candidatus Woesebacteria bacterium GW2011_GWB1_39_12]
MKAVFENGKYVKPLPDGTCKNCGKILSNPEKPRAIFCNRKCFFQYVGKPSISTMEKWSDDGVAKALDGCRVEPDGICAHGQKSWLLHLGII